jgi:hypothetical protein
MFESSAYKTKKNPIMPFLKNDERVFTKERNTATTKCKLG